MFCCVCNGTCNHVGPHSYCAAHGGSQTAAPYVTSPNTGPLLPSVWQATIGCEHCYCIWADDYQPPDHWRCCKCRQVMHDKFVVFVTDAGDEG